VFRNATLVRILLAAFGLMPIAAWIAFAAKIEPSGFGRSIGQAILVVLSPLPSGGLLELLGAGLMGRWPRAARVLATIGAAIVGLVAVLLAAVWGERIVNCGGPSGICTPELLEAFALLGYALLQGWLIALIWRARASGPAANSAV
jgi:hypothetical protein